MRIKRLMLRNVPEMKGKVDEAGPHSLDRVERFQKPSPIVQVRRQLRDVKKGLARPHPCVRSRERVSLLSWTFREPRAKGGHHGLMELLGLLFVASGTLAVGVCRNRKDIGRSWGFSLLRGALEARVCSSGRLETRPPNLPFWPPSVHLWDLIRAPISWGWRGAQGDQWNSTFLLPSQHLKIWAVMILDVPPLHVGIWVPCPPGALAGPPRLPWTCLQGSLLWSLTSPLLSEVHWGVSGLWDKHMTLSPATVDLQPPWVSPFLAGSYWGLFGAKHFFCNLIVSGWDTVFPAWAWIEGTPNLRVPALEKNGSCWKMWTWHLKLADTWELVWGRKTNKGCGVG